MSKEVKEITGGSNDNPLPPHSRLEKLLVAIDGSEISDYALNLAIHIGEAFSSQVDLIYVMSATAAVAAPPPIYDPGSGGTILTPATEWETTHKDLEKILSKSQAIVDERKRLVIKRGLKCEGITLQSDDVGPQIIKFASSGRYGMIVIGSRGLSGLHSLILGSVSKKVAKEAKTSVLVVKNKVEGVPKILLAYDGSDEAKQALGVAAEIGARFNGEVDPLSVVSIPISAEGLIVPDSISNWEKEMAGYAKEAYETLKIKGVKCGAKTIDSPDIARGITEEAETGSYDLIVVGSRGYGRLKSFFLGSVASGVADGSKTNVLIVR